MIERVTGKYGAPTAIGDGRVFYFYKAGKVMSVKEKYTPASAVDALNAPLNPKAAVALNDANGRGSCVAILKRAQATDKTLPKLADDAKARVASAIADISDEHIARPVEAVTR